MRPLAPAKVDLFLDFYSDGLPASAERLLSHDFLDGSHPARVTV